MEKGRKSLSYDKPWLISALLLSAAVLASCSSSPKPATTPGATAAPTTILPAALPDLPPPPPMREVAASTPQAVKVISDGTENNPQTSLIEASRRAKAKKRNEGESRPSIEITDENLKDFSNGGQVFVLEAGDAGSANDRPIPEAASATESAATSGPDTRTQAYSGETAGESDKELFWRQSVSELRTALRQTVDNLKRIELESTLLRQQFYSESDPFVRDSEVKPRWDRALDQLGALRKKAKQDREALGSLLNEAKKAGISSEWLGESTSIDLTEEEIRLINGSPAPVKP